MRIVFLSLLLGAALPCGCGGRSATAAPARLASGDATSLRAAARQALRRLAASVESLTNNATGSMDPGVVQASRDLADALDLLPDRDGPASAKMREIAQRMGESKEKPLEEVAKETLGVALRVLAARAAPSGHRLDYQVAVAALGRAFDLIKVRAPVTDGTAVAAAFRAATDAAFIASGGDPPFGEAEASGAGETPGSLELEVEQARAAVLELGQSRWTRARTASARALSQLADVVVAADPERRFAKEASDIRFQSERLIREDSLGVGQTGWVKRGLSVALDALGGLRPDCATLMPWTSSARKAVAGLKEGASLAFQRASIQDAFRATVDAFLMASQAGPACAGLADRSRR